VNRELERGHLRSGNAECLICDLGNDQSQTRVGALSQELARWIHHHPAAVVAQTELVDVGLVEWNSPRRLDGVDSESGQTQGHRRWRTGGYMEQKCDADGMRMEG
jgi:hypothetical protein